jgi:exonuclease VII small subunit
MTTMTNGGITDSLEQKLQRLEAIAKALESPATGLSDAITLCEESAGLSEDIDVALARCDERVRALIERLRPDSGLTPAAR